MKHLKKLAALLLALVMVLALSPAASAAGAGSITVVNPQKDQKYTAYKIFDVVYNTAKDKYSYTIDGDSEWFDVVASVDATGAVTSKITGLEFQKLYSEDPNKTIYAVKEKEGAGFSAAAFANTLKGNINGKTGTELNKPDGTGVSVTGLDLGYYFVTSSTGALCNLTTTNPAVDIHDKNDIPFEKTDDAQSVEIGQTVTYTITGEVPDTSEFTKYTYEISDIMSEGLTFQKNTVVVKIGDTTLNEADNDYKFIYDENKAPNTFTVSIDVMKQKGRVGEKITVTYSAIVNEKAVATVSENKATLVYSNDPTDDTKTGNRTDEDDVYSAKIVIDKIDGKDNTIKLADAKFVLYKNVTEGGTEIKKYYQYTEAQAGTPPVNAKVDWVEDIAGATKITTNDDGEAVFNGLADGTYYLEEIEAPTGYNPLKGPVEVKIEGKRDNNEEVIIDTLTYTASIANNAGTLLPSTGGMGTTLFYVIGGILAVGAAVLLVVKRRMRTEK